MKQILRDRHGSLRNGWWILAFLALVIFIICFTPVPLEPLMGS